MKFPKHRKLAIAGGPQAVHGYVLDRALAAVTTDTGHQHPSASFGFDPVARVDNAHDRMP